VKQDEKPTKKDRYNISLSDYQKQILEEKINRTGMLKSQALLSILDNGCKFEEAQVVITLADRK